MKSERIDRPSTKHRTRHNLLAPLRSTVVLPLLIAAALMTAAVAANNHGGLKKGSRTKDSASSKLLVSSTPVFNPGPSNSTDSALSSTPISPKAQGGPSGRLRAVHFRITALGIEPAELTLPAGRYLVAVDNDSGFNEVDIRIDREGGPQVARSQLSIGRRKARLFIDFAPGRYVLTDPGDSKRVSSFTITN